MEKIFILLMVYLRSVVLFENWREVAVAALLDLLRRVDARSVSPQPLRGCAVAVATCRPGA